MKNPKRVFLINDRFDLAGMRMGQASYLLKRYEAMALHARRKGWILSLGDRRTDPRRILRDGVDGLVLTVLGHGRRALSTRGEFEGVASRVPTVFWSVPALSGDFDFVGPDEAGGVSGTLDRLESLGFRRFSFFGPQDEPYTRDRFQAFCRWHRRRRRDLPLAWTLPWDPGTGELSSAAPRVRRSVVSDEGNLERRVRELSKPLRALPAKELPEVVLCDTDTSAGHLIRLWGGVPGRTMPGVVGFDDLDLPFEPWGYNYLTSVRSDLAAQASAVARLLERRMADPRAAWERVSVASRCVLRLTSLPPLPGRGLAVAESLLVFLKDHFRDPDVTAVAEKRFGMSAAALQRRLSRATGKSWRRVLESLRVESAARELRATRRTVTEIYLDNGWRQHANFAAAFRRRFGTTPEKYRRDASAAKR